MRTNLATIGAIGIAASILIPVPRALAQGNRIVIALDRGSGTVEFHATGHPSALKIVGKGAGPIGTFAVEGRDITGTAQFELSSLDTGISLRNRHMKEKYLEVRKYPQAKLTVTRMTLPRPLRGDVSFESVPFTGKLLLHGVERLLNGVASLEKKGGRISVKVRFGLRVKDYGIYQPSFAGVTMADEVQVITEAAAPYAGVRRQ